MSAGCLRWLLRHTARDVCSGGGVSLSPWLPPPNVLLLSSCTARHNTALSWRWARFTPFSTSTVDPPGEAPPPRKKQHQDPRARVTIGSVGRKIPQRHLQVIGETGESLGIMHRAEVIKLMDERGLKLVSLDENKDPPVYRLMTGKQIHEQQMQLREKQKSEQNTSGPVQVKELTLNTDIGAHDLTTKLKQVQNWLDRKHHVKLTLRPGRRSKHAQKHTQEEQEPLDTALEQMVQQIEVMVGFVSKPQVIRDGKFAMCVLRLPSAKELSLKAKELPQKKQNKTTESPTPLPDTAESPTSSPDSPTDTKDPLPN